MTLSVIIATREITDDTRFCIRELEQAPEVQEIIVLPDGPENKIGTADVPKLHNKTLIWNTGKVSPGFKRNLGARIASGGLFGFLDGDVVPAPWWASVAKQTMKFYPEIAALGGPSIAFYDAGYWERFSNGVYSCRIVSGKHRRRYVPSKSEYVDDLPSCNLVVRAAHFDQAKGFPIDVWPGEDSLFCDRLLGVGKILYSSDVQVWHRRRNTPWGHISQAWRYAWHRGWFFRKYAGNSRKIEYCVPLLFVIGLACGWAVQPEIWVAAVAVYVMVVLVSAARCIDVALYPSVVAGIVATHITYGVGFLRGFLKR